MGLSMAERKAVTNQMARRCAERSKKEKGAMLYEPCALTGWTHRRARWALIGVMGPVAPRTPAPSPKVYGADVLEALRLIWAPFGAGPASDSPRSCPESSRSWSA